MSTWSSGRRCADCGGTGKCAQCDGTGVNTQLDSDEPKCPYCKGSGVCSACNGGEGDDGIISIFH